MSGYFDHNATTPLHPAAREAWLTASDRFWHNPSSLYREAAEAKQRLEDARERLGELLGCSAERIIFTSGATESNNALFRALAARLPRGASVLTSALEHPSVLAPLREFFRGHHAAALSLPDTRLDTDHFHQMVRDGRPALVSVMAASNECGTLLPWQELAADCNERGILFHTDASQWIGKLPAHDLGLCDYVTGSAHKFGGPKGCGFLVVRHEDEALQLQCGGPQEAGRRAGTENYPAIMAMVAALEALTPRLQQIAEHQQRFRDTFSAEICCDIPGTRVIGEHAPRLWNTVMLLMPRHDHRKWLARLSQAGFAVSTGSACSSGTEGASQVLQAIGASPEERRRVLRLSAGWDTADAEWRGLAEAMRRIWSQLEG